MKLIEAREIFGLEDGYSKLELDRSYKNHVRDLYTKVGNSSENEEIVTMANKLYDYSLAYLTLMESGMTSVNSSIQQPLVIFTDASVYQDNDRAAFGIVTENMNMDFSLPAHTIEKYDVREEPDSSREMCILTGIVRNFGVDATELVAILAALEIFQFLIKQTSQKVVFYTDSLTAKKIFTDDRMPPGTKVYSDFRSRFRKIADDNNIEVIIKKVEAHAGHELNEIADTVARNRREIANHSSF